jgi:hypothetical protein
MHSTSTDTPRPIRAGFSRSLAIVLGLLAFTASAQTPVTIGLAEGNNATITGPGLKLTLDKIFTFDSAPAWKLTSFTWLSTKRSGANPTGRGQLLVFDASKFNPAGKTYAAVNGETTGLIAVSATYSKGEYVFHGDVILERGKTYYFLNSAAITTHRAPAAPHLYGFNSSRLFDNIERWTANESAWSPASSPGAPNFSATLTPVSVKKTPAR